jgi:sugar fermentation stimulation protein A
MPREIPLKFEKALVEGTLVRRYMRFFADVQLADGRVVTAHCPNTGSLLGCKDPGLKVYLLESDNPERKLRFTWVLVQAGSAMINIETQLPNRVVAEEIAAGRVPELAGYTGLRREVPYGRNSRIDILLEGHPRDPRACHVEVKCTTLGRAGMACFPDAVTERGRKHLIELAKIVKKGGRAVQFFFCSRTDVTRFRPAADIDPEYAKALRRAAKQGVEVLAWRAKVQKHRLELDAPIPVELGP